MQTQGKAIFKPWKVKPYHTLKELWPFYLHNMGGIISNGKNHRRNIGHLTAVLKVFEVTLNNILKVGWQTMQSSKSDSKI